MHQSGKLPVFVSSNLNSSAEILGDLLGRFEVYGRKLNELSGGEVQKFFVLGGFDISEDRYRTFAHLELIRAGERNPELYHFWIAITVPAKKGKYSTEPSGGRRFICFFSCGAYDQKNNGPRHWYTGFIHGTFRNSGDGILKSRVRKKYLGFVVSHCKSIRVVSKEILEELTLVYNLKNVEISIAPIPVTISHSRVRPERSKVVTFAGRIHNERGLNRWVSMIRDLSAVRDDFTCLVMGDGAESKYFQGELAQILPSDRLRFTGKLVKSEVLKEFNSAGILLSTAPSEGFGLAIREAMSAGVRVCAFSTSGLRELQLNFPRLISTFQTETEGVAILSELLNSETDTSEVLSFRQYLENENKINLNNLILGWLSYRPAS